MFLLKSRLFKEGIEREAKLFSASMENMFVERSKEVSEGRGKAGQESAPAADFSPRSCSYSVPVFTTVS